MQIEPAHAFIFQFKFLGLQSNFPALPFTKISLMLHRNRLGVCCAPLTHLRLVFSAIFASYGTIYFLYIRSSVCLRAGDGFQEV